MESKDNLKQINEDKFDISLKESDLFARLKT